MRFTGFVTMGTATVPINTISAVDNSAYGFSLDQFPNFAPMQNIYEQVRIDSVSIIMTLTAQVGNTDQPPRVVNVVFSYDPDGGADPNARDIFSRQNLKFLPLSFSNPCKSIAGIPGTLSSDGRVEKRLFYDLVTAGSKKFYLGKFVAICDGFNGDPSSARINLATVIKVKCTFKGLR
jgi:hypothetical protein